MRSPEVSDMGQSVYNNGSSVGLANIVSEYVWIFRCRKRIPMQRGIPKELLERGLLLTIKRGNQ